LLIFFGTDNRRDEPIGKDFSGYALPCSFLTSGTGLQTTVFRCKMANILKIPLEELSKEKRRENVVNVLRNLWNLHNEGRKQKFALEYIHDFRNNVDNALH
jgi:hypothetical protein